MNYHELMIAGTGGKGVLLIGRLLAQAGMKKYEHALFFPNYAPAMRGGECECTVIMSDKAIGYPVMFEPVFTIIMTSSALMLMENRVKPNGCMMIDSSIITEEIKRDDITVYRVPATEKAVELGGTQAANMVLLGAYLELTKAVSIEVVMEVLENKLKDKSHKAILELNNLAMNEGAKLMAKNAK